LNRNIFLLSLILSVGLIFSVPSRLESQPKGLPRDLWQKLQPGLELGRFVPAQKSTLGDSAVKVLRIDPRHFEFRLLNASAQTNIERKSVKDWVIGHGLVAGINASMYQKDNLTSVSYMKTRDHTNSTWVSKDRTFLAFNPKDKTLPAAKIFDRDCEDFEKVRKQYRSLIQSIRMVSCDGKNVWAPQNKKWSTAAIGMDSKGRILFIHARSPYTTHDFINILLTLPIDLKRAMYVEGGKDAQLYINTGRDEFEFLGNYSTAVDSTSGNAIAWPVPNVVGIAPISNHK
jgi:Phosphodiester glycosidase